MLFERKLFPNHRFKRVLSILLVYVLAFAVVAVLLGLIVPQVVQSIKDLAGNMQTYMTSLDEMIQNLTEQFDLDADAINDMFGNFQNMMSNLSSKAAEVLPQLLDVGFAIGSGVIAGITALISSIYMLAGKDRLVPQLKSCFMPRCPSVALTGCWRFAAMPTGFLWALSTAKSLIPLLLEYSVLSCVPFSVSHTPCWSALPWVLPM